MALNKQSPKITHLSWGQVKVEGIEKTFKDAKLYPGGAREWNWNETGTNHTPGTQPADVEELLENGAEVVVLSKGHNEMLQVTEDTINMLKEKGITFHILNTDQAKNKYNELAGKQPVGALIHSTC